MLKVTGAAGIIWRSKENNKKKTRKKRKTAQNAYNKLIKVQAAKYQL